MGRQQNCLLFAFPVKATILQGVRGDETTGDDISVFACCGDPCARFPNFFSKIANTKPVSPLCHYKRHRKGKRVTSAVPTSPASAPLAVVNAATEVRKSGTVSVAAPVAMWVKEHCAAVSLGLGDLLLELIETHQVAIEEELRPRTVGGTLFDQRPVEPIPAPTPQRSATVPLSFRLRPSDFTVLDDLRSRWGASNRTHLLRVALQIAHDTHNPQPSDSSARPVTEER